MEENLRELDKSKKKEKDIKYYYQKTKESSKIKYSYMKTVNQISKQKKKT